MNTQLPQSSSPAVIAKDLPSEELQQMPLIEHLVALRQHLFKTVGVLFALFFCLLPFCQSNVSTTLRTVKSSASCQFIHDRNRCYCNIYGTL